LGIDGRRVPRPARRGIAAVAITVLAVALAAFGPRLASHAWHSFRHTGSGAQSSNPTQRLTSLSGTRYNLWRVALDGFDAQPAAGTGAGTYGFWWHQNARDSESVRNAHNLWFENMQELGLPGLLLILSVAGAVIFVGVAARRRSRRSTSAGVCVAILCAFVVYLLSASVDWMWQSTAVTVLALAGIAILGARLAHGPASIRRPVRAALVAFAVVAGALQIPGLIATTELRRSQSAARAGHVQQALAWARDAIAAEPWAASGYEQRGLVLEADGRLAAAAADLRRAISHEPTNFVHWLLLARIQTERGLYDAALWDYEQAQHLDRMGQVFQLSPTYGIF
jgi:O-antigen ligase